MIAIPTTFAKAVGDTTYQIDARPVELVLLCAGVALALLIALVVAARKRRAGAVVSPLFSLLSLPFAGFPMFVYTTRDLVWSSGDERTASSVFRGAILLDGLAAGVGVGVAIAALLVLALRTRDQLRLLGYALPCAALGIAATHGARHADAVCAAGWMPFYEIRGQRDVHVGRDRDIPVHLMRPPTWRLFGTEHGPQPIDGKAMGWSGANHVHMHSARNAGEVPFVVEATHGPVTLMTTLHVRAVPEVASPLFSLRVGDRFVYRVSARTSGGALLYFISLSGYETLDELTIEVMGTRERNGFRTFVVEIRRADSAADVEVVALNGETRFYDAETETVGEQIVSFDFEDAAASPDPVACTFNLMEAIHARCQRGGRDADVPAASHVAAESSSRSHARASAPAEDKRREKVAAPPVAFEGAAPAAFAHHTSSTVGGIATVFVAILTVGLVILPDGSTASSYTLVESHRGPAGAPEALPR